MECHFQGEKIQIPAEHIRSVNVANKPQAVIVISHRWLEQFAVEHNIHVDYLSIFAQEGHYVFKVTLTFGGEEVQAIGEASRESCQGAIATAYMGTMAANRAFDRAMLKVLRLFYAYGSSENFLEDDPSVHKDIPKAGAGSAPGAKGAQSTSQKPPLKEQQASGKTQGGAEQSNGKAPADTSKKIGESDPDFRLIVTIGPHAKEQLTILETAEKHPDTLKRIAQHYVVKENKFNDLIIAIKKYAKLRGWPTEKTA